MGLKSGSRDAGLDESGDDTDHADDDTTTANTTVTESARAEPEPTSVEPTDTASDPDDTERASTSQRPTMDTIPYKLRRAKVNEGREQVPFFLRADIIDAEDELQDTLEKQLGEDVYKSDYREAAMVVAQRNPDRVAAVLREWGYDLDAI
jgi:flagellar biosynthesis/type III secretory pathway M-ring protein FliF/YscJ